MTTGYYSTDPLKNEIISDILRADTRPDFNLKVSRAKEEGFGDDEIVLEWIDFRLKLVFTDESKF